MQIIHGLKGLGLAMSALRSHGTVALVPTMGALHEGHLALVREARARADKVVASIFVNPLQFNDKADLDRYPRDEDADARKLEGAGCDLLWMPSAADFYPEGFATTVHVDGITERWEGEHRPGHFDGVATVVTKLFTNTRPDLAIFGEKDFQQLALIRRFTRDLNLGVDIVGHMTVREEDGLAMSSRNALLSSDERTTAVVLNHALKEARRDILAGKEVKTVLSGARAKLTKAGFGPIDYVAYVDPDTLEPLDERANEGRLIAAAFLGKVRLIDNFEVKLAA
ncbi:pantoate--beta-alanine ligase [Sphingomicrobium marinum]|uniref:pantoate--beta-alanine ligase n=1 Tax=Sphingomicrobium marinum TaxID=1227950 RepID=UPI002240E0F2|nr:pantoate--beta-alanine ligase [Sphingomicrobium marinum]